MSHNFLVEEVVFWSVVFLGFLVLGFVYPKEFGGTGSLLGNAGVSAIFSFTLYLLFWVFLLWSLNPGMGIQIDIFYKDDLRVRFVERMSQRFLSMGARHVLIALLGFNYNPTVLQIHEKLMCLAGKGDSKNFWLLYQTAEALGLEEYLIKRTHANIVKRYASLYLLERQVGPIGRNVVIKKEYCLWNEMLNDLGLQLARKIAEYRTDFFVKLCEESDNILEFGRTQVFQEYRVRCETLLEKCKQYHTKYLSHLNFWFNVYRLYPTVGSIEGEKFIPSGEIPQHVNNQGFYSPDPKLVELKDYFNYTKKFLASEVY